MTPQDTPMRPASDRAQHHAREGKLRPNSGSCSRIRCPRKPHAPGVIPPADELGPPLPAVGDRLPHGDDQRAILRRGIGVVGDPLGVDGLGLAAGRLAVDHRRAERDGHRGDFLDRPLAPVDLDEVRDLPVQDKVLPREPQGTDEDVFPLLVREHERADPGEGLAVDHLFVHPDQPIGVLPLLPGVGAAGADEVPLVPRTLEEAAFGGADGVDAALAPHREEEAGADPAELRVVARVAVAPGLDPAVERRAAQVAQPDRGDVEADRRRDVLADRHVHAQALERDRLPRIPPGIDQVPGHRGVCLRGAGGIVGDGPRRAHSRAEEDGECERFQPSHGPDPPIAEAGAAGEARARPRIPLQNPTTGVEDRLL